MIAELRKFFKLPKRLYIIDGSNQFGGGLDHSYEYAHSATEAMEQAHAHAAGLGFWPYSAKRDPHAAAKLKAKIK